MLVGSHKNLRDNVERLFTMHNGLCDDVSTIEKKHAKLLADFTAILTWATDRGFKAPNADLGFPGE